MTMSRHSKPPHLDLGNSGLMGLTELRERVRPDGRVLTRASVNRWVTRGVCGIRMPAIRVGNRWFSTEEALHWFVKASTSNSCGAAAGRNRRAVAKPPRHHADLSRSIDELKSYGFDVKDLASK